jgi:outer membrane usher protein
VLLGLQLLAAPAQADGGPAMRKLWVDVQINEQRQPAIALLSIDAGGRWFVRPEDAQGWQLRLPPSDAPEANAGVRIDNVPGLHAHLSAHDSCLQLQADSSLFPPQYLDARRVPMLPQGGLPALFSDYELFALRYGSGSEYSAHVALGASDGRAALTSDWLAHRSVPESGAAAQDAGSVPGWVRLETALGLDYPEYTARLTAGDSISAPGTLGSSVRFAGLHWATDFSVQPTLVPFALPAVSGLATLPSSVDLYLDQSLIDSHPIDSGPFELRNIPVPLGRGDVQLQVKDLLGQEQTFSIPYLVTPQLLAAGLTTSDMAAGIVRENFGLASFDYGGAFVSGMWQRGLSQQWTGGGSFEVTPRSLTARLGGATRLGLDVVASVDPAMSVSPAGVGGAVAANIDSTLRSGSLGIRITAASASYRELGSASLPLRLEVAGQASADLHRMGSVALICVYRDLYGSAASSATTLTYALNLPHAGTLGLAVTRTRGTGADTNATLTLTRALGPRTTASAGLTFDGHSTGLTAGIDRSAPSDSGWGWQLLARSGALAGAAAQLEDRTPYGVGILRWESGAGAASSTSLDWHGGVLWSGQQAWFGRDVTSSAALVELPGIANVRVLQDGQPVGRTDQQGQLLIAPLRPFEDNHLTIVAEDLPLSALVDADAVTVRPYSHGVVSAAFPVVAAASRVLVLKLDAAHYVPAGATVTLASRRFLVGENGLVQLPQLPHAVQALVQWRGGGCTVQLPADADIGSAQQPAVCTATP